MKKIALIGAGGKMGLRLSNNLIKSDYQVNYLEISENGIEKLKALGVGKISDESCVSETDIVILAVPDVIIGKLSDIYVPKMRSGSMLFILDPAAALAGKLHKREDISYFIAHPSHPSIFNWEPSEEAQKDYFGGTKAKQTVVCALMSGNENDYQTGEDLAKTIYAPVYKAFKITAEQMGLLEPALVETLCSTLQVIVREGLDEVVSRGVPVEAAKEFLLGHLNIQLAVLYDQIPGAVFSDAANKAIVRGKPLLVKPDWKKVFEPDNVMEQINDIIT